MRFSLISAALAAVVAASAGDYIIVYEKGFETPDRIVQNVASTLKNVGATIHYEFHTVIKGFSVFLPDGALDVVHGANDEQYPFVIKPDTKASAW